jgi:hypothetical protein
VSKLLEELAAFSVASHLVNHGIKAARAAGDGDVISFETDTHPQLEVVV